MEYVYDQEFKRLHGEKLFKMLAMPMQKIVKEKHYNADANALVSGKIIDSVIRRVCSNENDKKALGECWNEQEGSYSFILLKKCYIKRHGRDEWNRIYPIIEMLLEQWLDYHKK